MNLPNGLTLLRIFFVPVLIVILLTRSPNIDLLGYQVHFEVWGVLILLMARLLAALPSQQGSDTSSPAPQQSPQYFVVPGQP